MTIKEMSDSLDSLLNSYANQAVFGEESAKQDIVLDEYEKSLYLTQAQDIILKSYFQRTTNGEGNGFDDSEKRQIDFSSLITIKTLSQTTGTTFDERGILFAMPKRQVPIPATYYTTEEAAAENSQHLVADGDGREPGTEGYITTYEAGYIPVSEGDVKVPAGTNDVDGTTDVLYILNEQLLTKVGEAPTGGEPDKRMKKTYVVVPINYKEYDREMSKPYAQPLKKQAWRLFQNAGTGFDYLTELIPVWDLTAKETITGYKMRYVRRPNPIVLADMPDGLSVEGFSEESPCELNPILHPEIVQKAVDIIIASRGGGRQLTQRQ